MGSLNLPTCPARHAHGGCKSSHSDNEAAHNSPLSLQRMPQAQRQCFALGWIYAGEMLDFSWRRLAGAGQARFFTPVPRTSGRFRALLWLR